MGLDRMIEARRKTRVARNDLIAWLLRVAMCRRRCRNTVGGPVMSEMGQIGTWRTGKATPITA